MTDHGATAFAGKTFIKQYGAKRTGTNYLRALLVANYPDVTPLMHVLGDKHSAPLDWEIYLTAARASADPDWEFVRSATYAAPADSTRPDDAPQAAYLKRIAAPVARSARAGTVGFVVSARHPYAWLAGLVQFSFWVRPERGEQPLEPTCLPLIVHACHDYNAKYQAWLDHCGRFASRSALVRHEDLVEDPTAILARLERVFGLQRSRRQPDLPDRKVLPADWDQCHPAFDVGRFDRADCAARAGFGKSSTALRQMADEHIDWAVAAELGYRR